MVERALLKKEAATGSKMQPVAFKFSQPTCKSTYLLQQHLQCANQHWKLHGEGILGFVDIAELFKIDLNVVAAL